MTKYKIYKSYEILKLIEEKPEIMEGESFELLYDETNHIKNGTVVTVGRGMIDNLGLFHGGKRVFLNGFEVWEQL